MAGFRNKGMCMVETKAGKNKVVGWRVKNQMALLRRADGMQNRGRYVSMSECVSLITLHSLYESPSDDDDEIINKASLPFLLLERMISVGDNINVASMGLLIILACAHPQRKKGQRQKNYILHIHVFSALVNKILCTP